MIGTGNHFWDKVGVKFTISPDGTLDTPPVWTIDPPELQPFLLVDTSDLFAVLQVDSDVANFAVTVQAEADSPDTPEVDKVSETFVGSFSHSKATTLNGAVSEVPRV